jgi:AraC-like DNA-binding protein
MQSPYRKIFNNDTPFPFDMRYRSTRLLQAELPDHLHDWYELVYVYSGQGTFFIDQTFYAKEAGCLFLLPANTIHRAFPDEQDPFTTTAVFFSGSLLHEQPLGESFSYLDGFEEARRQTRYRIVLNESQRSDVEELLSRMQRELESGKPGHRHVVSLLLRQLLVAVVRYSNEVGSHSARDASPSFGPQWMRSILRHIDAHPEEPLTLSALAARAAVSPAHFSRVFKKLTGMNVTEYVTIKRVARAKELLSATDDNVEAAAERCGFESLPHFHRMFKKFAGMTPAAYRRQSRRQT